MEKGLLLCDIGNTALKIGIAKNGEIVASYALPSSSQLTADSLGFQLLDAARHAGMAPGAFEACVAASVVPALNPVFKGAARKYLDLKPIFAPDDLAIPLQNHYRQPAEVGADRLVGAFAAREALPGVASLIIVDFGTAVTFDCVSGDAYLGGLIFPGPATAAAGLASHTAKLPHVSLDAHVTGPVLCENTTASIQHGLIFGYVCLTEGLCGLLRKQLPEPVKIVATGGFAAAIGHLTKIFDLTPPDLILDGLARLYRRSKNAEQ